MIKRVYWAQKLLYVAILLALFIIIAQPFLLAPKWFDGHISALIVASLYSLVFVALLALSAFELKRGSAWPRFMIVILFLADALPALIGVQRLWLVSHLLVYCFIAKLILVFVAIVLLFLPKMSQAY